MTQGYPDGSLAQARSPYPICEAYMNRGDRELAIKNYKESLDLNPKNVGAAAALAKLKAGK